MFSCHKPLGFLLSNGEHGIFNVCSDLRKRWAHEAETAIDKSAHVLEEPPNGPLPCPDRESNPGWLLWLDHPHSALTTEPRPLSGRVAFLSYLIVWVRDAHVSRAIMRLLSRSWLSLWVMF